jgi:hypothetical protein
MKVRTVMTSVALVLLGALGGAALTVWRVSVDLDDWWAQNNMVPMLEEQTFVLKYLRRDEPKPLQALLEQGVWRIVELYAGLQAQGKRWPENSKRSIEYHCALNKEQPGSNDAAEVIKRAAWCESLLRK